MWTATAARLNPPDPRCSFAGPLGAARLPVFRPAALGAGPGRRVRTALDIPRPTAESVAVSSRFHCRAWSAASFPLPRHGVGRPRFLELLCRSERLRRSGCGRPCPGWAGRASRSGPVQPGAAWCSGWSADLTWQDRTRPSSPRRPGERGMRNGNVPRRSTHPLEVFPCVQ
jgi:hypothetical protein